MLPSIRKSGGYGSIDIEKIITATATAVAAEIVKQIVPIMTQPLMWEEPELKKLKPRKPTGIIWKLSPELRSTVNEMLRANMSYKDVQTYLSLNGIGISQAAICNYYDKVIGKEDV